MGSSESESKAQPTSRALKHLERVLTPGFVVVRDGAAILLVEIDLLDLRTLLLLPPVMSY